MPSTSKSQQRLFGMVHAYQKGKLKHAPARVREIAEHISEEDAEHFAKTRHDGLPERKGDDDGEEKSASRRPETYESGEGVVESCTPGKTEDHDEIVLRLDDGRRVRISNNTRLGRAVMARIGSRMGYHGYRIGGTDVVHKVHSNARSRGGWLEEKSAAYRAGFMSKMAAGARPVLASARPLSPVVHDIQTHTDSDGVSYRGGDSGIPMMRGTGDAYGDYVRGVAKRPPRIVDMSEADARNLIDRNQAYIKDGYDLWTPEGDIFAWNPRWGRMPAGVTPAAKAMRPPYGIELRLDQRDANGGEWPGDWPVSTVMRRMDEDAAARRAAEAPEREAIDRESREELRRRLLVLARDLHGIYDFQYEGPDPIESDENLSAFTQSLKDEIRVNGHPAPFDTARGLVRARDFAKDPQPTQTVRPRAAIPPPAEPMSPSSAPALSTPPPNMMPSAVPEKTAAWRAGFMSKCAEYGVDGRALLKSAAMGTGDDFPVPTDEAVFEYDRRRPTFSKSKPMYDFMSGNPTLAGFPLSRGVRRHREMLAERDANGAGWTDYTPLVMSGIDRYLARRPDRPGREFVDGRGREIADDMNLRASSPEAFAERAGREVDKGLRSRYDALRWGRMKPGDRGSVPSVGFGGVGDDAGSGTRSWAGPDGTLAGGMA